MSSDANGWRQLITASSSLLQASIKELRARVLGLRVLRDCTYVMGLARSHFREHKVSACSSPQPRLACLVSRHAPSFERCSLAVANIHLKPQCVFWHTHAAPQASHPQDTLLIRGCAVIALQ